LVVVFIVVSSGDVTVFNRSAHQQFRPRDDSRRKREATGPRDFQMPDLVAGLDFNRRPLAYVPEAFDFKSLLCYNAS
jgi:hypothetical protein